MSYYSVKSFGAVPNGEIDCALFIQKAIDEAEKNGGGTVVLDEAGVYYSSSITLKKNVELKIEKGAVLKASSDIDSYIRPCETINDPKTALVGNPVTGKPSFAFIYGKDAERCSISGEGTIDGNCYAFVERKSQYYVTGNFYPRPTVIYLENCDHISVKDVTIKNAPFWTLHPAGCDDVLISGIRILNPLDVANSDGIDPDHCKNVRITNCHIVSADDCICLKNSKGNAEYGKCENIVISACTLCSTSSAIKIGTEGIDDFRNIIVSDCVISGSNRGISIQIRDCGNVENVTYNNIIIETRRFSPDWWGSGEAIAITAFNRGNDARCGRIKNIRFNNVACKGENGVLIYCQEDVPCEDISFENLRVTLSNETKWEKGIYDLRPGISVDIERGKNYPIFIKNAKLVSLKNVRTGIEKNSDEYSKGIFSENTEELILEKVKNNE